MISAARMKNGIAISGKLSMPENSRCGRISGVAAPANCDLWMPVENYEGYEKSVNRLAREAVRQGASIVVTGGDDVYPDPNTNAQAIAEWLEGRDEVETVHYSGLPSSPWYAAGQKYMPGGAGAIVSFELRGGIEAGKRFVDAVELFSHLANIGDVRSLIIHPASTTHSQLADEELLASGVTPGLIRLSVGIEGVEDLKADLEAGFRAAKER